MAAASAFTPPHGHIPDGVAGAGRGERPGDGDAHSFAGRSATRCLRAAPYPARGASPPPLPRLSCLVRPACRGRRHADGPPRCACGLARPSGELVKSQPTLRHGRCFGTAAPLDLLPLLHANRACTRLWRSARRPLCASPQLPAILFLLQLLPAGVEERYAMHFAPPHPTVYKSCALPVGTRAEWDGRRGDAVRRRHSQLCDRDPIKTPARAWRHDRPARKRRPAWPPVRGAFPGARPADMPPPKAAAAAPTFIPTFIGSFISPAA